MARDSDRARRLSARRKAKAALEPLRALVRVLAEWERLEGADAVGVVEVAPRTPETDYGTDVLDVVGQAVSEAGENQVVEVFVTISPTHNIHRATPIGDQPCQQETIPARDSTRTSAASDARRASSRSAIGRTTRSA